MARTHALRRVLGGLALLALTGVAGCATEVISTIPNHPANISRLAQGAQRVGCQVLPLGDGGFVAECQGGKVDVPPRQPLRTLIVRCKGHLAPIEVCTEMVNRIAGAGAGR